MFFLCLGLWEEGSWVFWHCLCAGACSGFLSSQGTACDSLCLYVTLLQPFLIRNWLWISVTVSPSLDCPICSCQVCLTPVASSTLDTNALENSMPNISCNFVSCLAPTSLPPGSWQPGYFWQPDCRRKFLLSWEWPCSMVWTSFEPYSCMRIPVGTPRLHGTSAILIAHFKGWPCQLGHASARVPSDCARMPRDPDQSHDPRASPPPSQPTCMAQTLHIDHTRCTTWISASSAWCKPFLRAIATQPGNQMESTLNIASVADHVLCGMKTGKYKGRRIMIMSLGNLVMKHSWRSKCHLHAYKLHNHWLCSQHATSRRLCASQGDLTQVPIISETQTVASNGLQHFSSGINSS